MSSTTPPKLGDTSANVVPLRPAVTEEWFSRLFTDYARLVQRYIYRRTSSDAVEDLTAETFATAWRKRDEIPESLELQWLYKTAGFLIANYNRKRKPVLLEEFPEIAHDADPAIYVIEDAALRSAFYRLSEKDRKVLILAAWEGQNSEQIAQALDISPNAAAVALSRARARFSKLFCDESTDAGAQASTTAFFYTRPRPSTPRPMNCGCRW